jgi:hypothetical protein
MKVETIKCTFLGAKVVFLFEFSYYFEKKFGGIVENV